MKRPEITYFMIALVGLALISAKYIPFLSLHNDDLLDLLSNAGFLLYLPAFFVSARMRMRTEGVVPTPSSSSYAGLWFRFVAGVLDFLAINLVVTLTARSIIDLMRITGSNPDLSRRVADLGTGWQQAGFLLICFGFYYVLMEASPLEASLGKMALGLIVTDEGGNRISVARATLRYLGKIVSLGTVLVGFLVGMFTARKQALHDLVAKTVVVYA